MSSRSIVSASSRLLPVVAALLLLLAPALAEARKRIVVLDFTGPRAADFQEDVETILRKRHSVVSQASYVKTARKLKAGKPTAANVRKVAGNMSVDGLLIGSVRKIGPRYELTLKLRAGADGSFTSTITVRSRRPGLSGDALTQARGELLAGVVDLPPLEGDAEPVARGKGKTKGKVKGRGAPPVEPEEPAGDDDDDDDDDDDVAAAGDDDDDDGDDDGGGSGDDAGSAGAASASADVSLTAEQRADLQARGRGLDIAAGASFSGRRLTFTVRNGLGDLSPRGYDGALVAGAYVVGELYPMAFNLKNRSVTRNIGLTAMVDKVLKIESRLRYRDDANMEQVASLPTDQMRWGIGLVYRHNFGSRPTSPTLKLAARYNRAHFIIDKDAAPVVGGTAVVVDIPNMDYAYLDPGAALRFPIGTALALQADVRFLYITDTGEMQQMDQYGDATVTGIDADLGVEYRLSRQLSIRAGGRLIRIGYDFTEGNGAELVYNRDGDATTQDVFGAQDRYLGGYATAAYLY